MGNNKQIARNLFFNLLSFSINFGISFFFTPYLVRVLGREAYGFFPLTNSLVSYTSIITTAVGSMAGRFITMEYYGGNKEKAKEFYNSVIVANIFLSAVFTVLAIFGVIYLQDILKIPVHLIFDVKVLFALTFACLILSLPCGILSVGLTIKNRVDLGASAGITQNVVRVSVMLLLFWLLPPNIYYIGIAAFVSMLLGVGYGFYFKHRFIPEFHFRPNDYFSFSAVWVLISSGIWNSVNQLSNVLLQQLDLLISDIFISAAAMGTYALAKTLPNLMYTVLATLSGAFYPQFNILYAQNKHDELLHELLKSIKIMSAFMGIPIGLLCVYGDVFFTLWVPGQDEHQLYLLSILTLAPMIFGSSVNPIFGTFTITNKLRIPSIVLLVCGLLQTLVIFILLKTTNLGLWSIPIVSGIQGGLRNLLFTPMYGAHCIGRKWWAFYPAVARGCFGMVAVIIISYLAKQFYMPDSWITFLTTMAFMGTVCFIFNFYVIFGKEERKTLISKVKTSITNKFK